MLLRYVELHISNSFKVYVHIVLGNTCVVCVVLRLASRACVTLIALLRVCRVLCIYIIDRLSFTYTQPHECVVLCLRYILCVCCIVRLRTHASLCCVRDSGCRCGDVMRCDIKEINGASIAM